MAEQGLTRNQTIAELVRSPHGALAAYAHTGLRAAHADPEWFAHLVAWAAANGKVRDARVALPVLALAVPSHPAFTENALAHLASLDPRSLARAVAFATDLKRGIAASAPQQTGVALRRSRKPAVVHGAVEPQPVPMRTVRRLVARYLANGERDARRWEHVMVQHRKALQTLYRAHHIKAPAWVDAALLKGHAVTGVLADVKRLAALPADEAAHVIVSRKVPFLVARGALGARFREPALLRALIARMSPTELVTNLKMLERAGVKDDAALRGELDLALGRTAGSTKAVLKTSKAADAVADEALAERVRGVQERQLDKLSIEGDWLVLGDQSGSMAASIGIATEVAAVLARLAGGRVHLVFFNTAPRYVDATGKSLDALRAEVQHIRASGGTAIGCGLEYLRERKLEVDGIAIVSDGGDNTPPYFHQAYHKYATFIGKDVPVYLYHVSGEHNQLEGYCRTAGIDLQMFELGSKSPDYYSLPDLAATMRTNRYSLADEVLATPLKTLDSVLARTVGMSVVPPPRSAVAAV